jgi:hypothetical protein
MIQDSPLRIRGRADEATNVSLALDLSVFLKILAVIYVVLGLLALLLPGFMNHCHPVQYLALALSAIFLFTTLKFLVPSGWHSKPTHPFLPLHRTWFFTSSAPACNAVIAHEPVARRF